MLSRHSLHISVSVRRARVAHEQTAGPAVMAADPHTEGLVTDHAACTHEREMQGERDREE